VGLDLIGGVFVGFDHLAQESNLRKVRAKLIVQITSDAGSIFFERLLLPQEHQLPL
jgi:hypothetical protein